MTDTDTDTERLSARLAAVERALTDRTCDCAHEAFTPPDRSAPTTNRSDDDLREAVEAVCEYVLAHERASAPPDEHTAAVRAALDGLVDAPSVDSDPAPRETTTETDDTAMGTTTETGETPRAWLERVAATVFG